MQYLLLSFFSVNTHHCNNWTCGQLLFELMDFSSIKDTDMFFTKMLNL